MLNIRKCKHFVSKSTRTVRNMYLQILVPKDTTYIDATYPNTQNYIDCKEKSLTYAKESVVLGRRIITPTFRSQTDTFTNNRNIFIHTLVQGIVRRRTRHLRSHTRHLTSQILDFRQHFVVFVPQLCILQLE